MNHSPRNLTHIIPLFSQLVGLHQKAISLWSIASLDTTFTLYFDSTAIGVNVDVFTGAGFNPTPSWQLHSNAFITGGWSDPK